MKFLDLLGAINSEDIIKPEFVENMEELQQAGAMFKVFCLIIIGLMGAAAVFFAIWMGYRFATADTEEKRKNEKAHLFYALFGVVVVVGLIVIWTRFSDQLVAMQTAQNEKVINGAEKAAGTLGLSNPQSLIDFIKIITYVAQWLIGLLGIAAVIFAVYVGIKFFVADEEEKRKNAKMQFVYSIVGMFAALAIIILYNTLILDWMFG
ncbi:MAG: pilin [Christensenellaceae bacterium]|jgi:heme O synthase-like polyprenyltransferase|nr:pilin [Christensenellaceae bacterium]